ncbi:MAG: AmmeMemoRadiSam system protein B [Spirochaetia bacterium]|nr:AmmeMemoRadiSam system protein B [Spirochaetia bacterium]
MHDRSSITSGIFYPEDPQILQELIDSVLQQGSDPQKLPLAVGIPHAAYDRVLPHMGTAFSALQGTVPERIIILAPLHDPVLLEDAPAFIFCSPEQQIHTVLGDLRLDPALAQQVLSCSGEAAAIRSSYFEEETAVELAAPLLVRLFGQVSVLPLYIGGTRAADAQKLADLLRTIITEETLVILSLNLSAWEGAQESLTHRDALLDLMSSTAPVHYIDSYRRKEISTCGVLLLEALRRVQRAPEPWSILSIDDDTTPSSQGRRTQYGSALLRLQTAEIRSTE